MGTPTDHGLVRAIGRWGLMAMTINVVIGAGIFGLPAQVFARTGPWSLVAFAACAIVIGLIVLCFAEVSSRFAETGGPYLYAREAFGPVVGFEVGWLLWIARITAFAANCNLFADYLGFFWPGADAPGGRATVVVAVVGSLLAINLVGVRHATIASNVFTIAKIVPLALFVVVGTFSIDAGRLALGSPPGLSDFSGAVLLLVYAFTGFEVATIPGGESRDPRRDMPRALLSAIAFVAVFYFLIQFVAIGTLPGLASSKRPLADAAGNFLGSLGGTIISAGALVSIAGNLNVVMLAGGRLPWAMAERGELPRILASTHPRFHTPHVSLIATAAVILVLTLSGTFIYAATISVIARLLAYGATCAALPVLRRRRGAPPAAFLAPAGVAAAIAALLLAGWLLLQCTAEQARDSAIAAAVGLVLYALALRRKAAPDAPEPGS